MIAFTDRWGRPWTARLDVAAALRINDLAGFDVMSVAIDGRSADRLAANHSLAALSIYALFLPECDRRGIAPRRLAKRLRGWPWRWAVRPEELTERLIEEIDVFFAVPELSPGRPKGSSSERVTVTRLWGDVWRLAAIAGVDPLPHTFGALVALRMPGENTTGREPPA